MQPVYTVAPDASVDLIHIKAIREQLPRNLARLFPGLFEEVELALDEMIPAAQDGTRLCSALGNRGAMLSLPAGWVPVIAFAAVARIISRVSNRVFVNAPLCKSYRTMKSRVLGRLSGSRMFEVEMKDSWTLCATTRMMS